MENPARYIVRASFSQKSITYMGEESKVIYKSKNMLDLVHIHGIMLGHRKAKLFVRVGRKTTGLPGEDLKAAEI